MHEVTNTIGECFVEAKLLVVQTEVHSQRESFSVRYGKVGMSSILSVKSQVIQEKSVSIWHDCFLFLGKKTAKDNFFVPFSMFTSGLPLIGFFDFGEKSPAKAGKLVLVGQKTFCRTRTQLALFA